jgi:hypothetical protein
MVVEQKQILLKKLLEEKLLNLKNNLINMLARPCWKFKFFSKSV